jgi:uncharacterized protein
MKILVFSDIHSDLAALQNLMQIEADLYFAAGDLVSWGRGLDAVGPLLEQHAGRMYVLPGNHESEAAVQDLCDRFGLQFFHGKSILVEGFHIAGLGYSNPTPFDTPGEYSEQELAQRLIPFASLDPLILVCHCPPRGTALDQARPGAHYGSTAMKKFIETCQPRYFFCGHIHEAAGRAATLGATRAVNVGKKGFLLDFVTL